MDRIQFIHSINYKDKQLSDVIVNYFDQEMLLYELVDSTDKIELERIDKNIISYQIENMNPDIISALSNKISLSPQMQEYQKVINTSCSLVSNKIAIVTFVI